MGIPTKEANLQGLKATKQMVNMLSDQVMYQSDLLIHEIGMIKKEVRYLLNKVTEIGDGNLKDGVIRAFEAGILDVPFAPSIYNKGKLIPIRDNDGAVRILDPGFVPMEPEVLSYHKEKIEQRARIEKRTPNYQMLVDDIYAISKGRLVGRPRK